MNLYKPVQPERIKFIKDIKSPSVRSKEGSSFKNLADKSGKEKLTSTTSMTGVNSTNANSVLNDCYSIDGITHGSAKSRKSRRPFVPPLRTKLIMGSNRDNLVTAA